MTGFIASQIARINRNYALVMLILAAGACAIGWLGWNYISAVVLGPRAVSAEELATERFQSDPNSYKTVIRVSASEARPAFYSARVRRGKGYGTLYCWLVKVGDAQLIVEDWSPSASLSPAGLLRDAPQNIHRSAQAYLKTGPILPVLLDAREWKSTGWMLTICGSGLGIAAGVIAGMLWWWGTHPERHPVRRVVARLGDFDSIAMQIDGEMQAELRRFGAVHLGQSMLLYTSTFKFDVVRLDSLSAASTQWLQQGKTRALFLLLETRDARRVKWQIAKRDSDVLLSSVRAAAHLEQNIEAV